MAKYDPNPIEFPAFSGTGALEPYFKAQEEALKKLQEASAAIDFTKPRVDLTGALVSFQIADGYAYYVVSKNSPLTVRHVPFGDAWQAIEPTIRGLNRDFVLDHLRRTKMMRDLFSKKPTDPKSGQ